jgi:hypothetical protein
MRRHPNPETQRPTKMAQTFFALDADTGEPLCFLCSSSPRSVTQATPELLFLTLNRAIFCDYFDTSF